MWLTERNRHCQRSSSCSGRYLKIDQRNYTQEVFLTVLLFPFQEQESSAMAKPVDSGRLGHPRFSVEDQLCHPSENVYSDFWIFRWGGQGEKRFQIYDYPALCVKSLIFSLFCLFISYHQEPLVMEITLGLWDIQTQRSCHGIKFLITGVMLPGLRIWEI